MENNTPTETEAAKAKAELEKIYKRSPTAKFFPTAHVLDLQRLAGER